MAARKVILMCAELNGVVVGWAMKQTCVGETSGLDRGREGAGERLEEVQTG